ncbi:MAG: FN3 associated domain-containing protein [Pirellulaceae bacterium]
MQNESIDISSFASLLQAGENLLAIHGLNSSANDTDYVLDVALSAVERSSSAVAYLVPPTPGAPNVSDIYAGIVGDTTFSADRGFYTEAFDLEVTSSTPGSTLIYTTDGSIPSASNGTQVVADANATPKAVIPISTTTHVRVIAVKDGYLSSNVDTQTYIFLNDVIQQTITPGQPPLEYPATWQAANYSGDYEMDPEVVAQWDDNNPENDDFGIREALQSLPTMSIVMEHDDLWNSRTGIYPNATATGTRWRRAGSIEYFDPASGEEFQVNAGIQMHGGASRDNLRTKKHSFRVVFKQEFDGPSELNFLLFKDSPNVSINTFVLKSFFTDGFPTRTQTGRYSPLDSQYMRDTWMRDVRLNMGNLDAHSEYVHLYINGLYWGLYSPTERPDDAFAAEHMGGERENYDIVKDFNELYRGSKAAWNEMFSIANAGLESDEAYQRIQGNNPDGSPNADLPNYLDVDNLIDYMIQHLSAGPEDWPHHNWYAIRDRVGETKGFQFFTWDQEIVLDGRYRDRTEIRDAGTPAQLFFRLQANAEFRQRFADRVHLHMFNDGALTVANKQAAWMRRADQIEKAIIAESARWGDAREGERQRIDSRDPIVTIPVMTVDLWRAERDDVRDVQLPEYHVRSLAWFRADDLYPDIDAPTFNQRGGVVAGGFALALSAADGEIYYTLDGSDPRQVAGGISASAIRYTGPVTLSSDVIVNARALAGEEWSAIDSAAFEVGKATPTPQNLVISEIHFAPVANPDAEFIELFNPSDVAVSLTGVRFNQGIEFDFAAADRSIGPNERLVLVLDLAAFQQVHGDVAAVVGQFDSGRLDNQGEAISLVWNDQLLHQFTYSSDWYSQASQGYSLEAVTFGNQSEAAAWPPEFSVEVVRQVLRPKCREIPIAMVGLIRQI